MAEFIDFMTPITAFHWVALALILLGIEVAIGTYDLLWIALAGFATALFAAFAPESVAGWPSQAVVFAISSIILLVLGRTLFAGLRRVAHEHPTLNRRMVSLIGRRGVAATDFTSGVGRVKIGDTEWGAELTENAGAVFEGDAVIVDSTQSNSVRVRPAQ